MIILGYVVFGHFIKDVIYNSMNFNTSLKNKLKYINIYNMKNMKM